MHLRVGIEKSDVIKLSQLAQIVSNLASIARNILPCTQPASLAGKMLLSLELRAVSTCSL